MTQPPLFDVEPKWHDLWGGRRLTKDEFEHHFNDDPSTIRGLDAITDVGEYKPGGADESNWYTQNTSYTNDQMYQDMNHLLRVYRGKLPWGDPGLMDRIRRGESAVWKNVHSDPEEVQDVVDDMDDKHTNSRMHGLTALHRGIKDTVATFGDAANGDLTGHTFVEHAPMSTSPSDVVASSFSDGRYGGGEPAHLHILAPKGTPAVSTIWHGDKEGRNVDAGESEVILGRGGRYHVVHDDRGAGGRRRNIYVQYIGPDTSIHGKADLDNLPKHDPKNRFDLNMDRLREHTARQATGDDFDRYMDAGYEYEVEPHPEFDQARVTFTKPYYDRGIHHTVDYNDVTEHEWPNDIESTIRPLRRQNGQGRSYTRSPEVEYPDQDGGSVFHQVQKHVNRHPDDSHFFPPAEVEKVSGLLALAGSSTWEA